MKRKVTTVVFFLIFEISVAASDTSTSLYLSGIVYPQISFNILDFKEWKQNKTNDNITEISYTYLLNDNHSYRIYLSNDTGDEFASLYVRGPTQEKILNKSQHLTFHPSNSIYLNISSN